MSDWFIARGGRSEGPYSARQIREMLKTGELGPDALAWRKGMSGWRPVADTPGLTGEPDGTDLSVPPPVSSCRTAHEIDYEIFGEEMQFVEIELDPGESVVAEAGAMMYMDSSVSMQTVFGDGSGQEGGIMGRLLGAGKRLLTGESLFCTVFTHNGGGKGHVAFAAPYPGRIIPLDLRDYGGRIVCQKDAFLCAAKGVSIGIAFQKRIGVALFGGEGFIMQSLEGDGLAFVHAGGTIVEKELARGETLLVDTGCLVALTSSIDYDIQYAGDIKSSIFGGEGFFFARLAGPGHVWLQSLPFSRLAGRIYQAAPQTGGPGGAKGEGSMLGTLGNLFQE